MGLMASVKNLIQPKRDSRTLSISIDEMPKPRDWGTMELIVGNQILLSRDMALVGGSTEELLGWIEGNLEKIRSSGYERVEYANVDVALQEKINQVLQS